MAVTLVDLCIRQGVRNNLTLEGVSHTLNGKIASVQAQVFSSITTFEELKSLASPAVKKIDFSKNSHVKPEWLEALATLFPNVEELDVSGCRCMGDVISGLYFVNLTHLKVIKLTGSNFSESYVLRWFFDNEGNAKGIERIEMKGLLTYVIRSAASDRSWKIVNILTENRCWDPDEMRALLIERCLKTDPRTLTWRSLVARHVTSPIPINILSTTSGKASVLSEDGLFRFSYPTVTELRPMNQ